MLVASDLLIELSKEEQDLLLTLSSYIIQETRYPVTLEQSDDYCTKTNEITNFISSDKNFERGLAFFKKVREVIDNIDGTPEDIKFNSRMEMEQNGYVIFRIGGDFPQYLS